MCGMDRDLCDVCDLLIDRDLCDVRDTLRSNRKGAIQELAFLDLKYEVENIRPGMEAESLTVLDGVSGQANSREMLALVGCSICVRRDNNHDTDYYLAVFCWMCLEKNENIDSCCTTVSSLFFCIQRRRHL